MSRKTLSPLLNHSTPMKKLLLPAIAVLAAASAHAQLSYDTIGSVYTQDFNTLIQTGSTVPLTGHGPI